jgi:hypothetical protein
MTGRVYRGSDNPWKSKKRPRSGQSPTVRIQA